MAKLTQEQMQELLSQELDFDTTQYRGRGWTGKVKTFADLLRQVDSLDSAMGRKGTLIPGKNASEDEWKTFFQNIAATDDEYADAAKDMSENVRADFVSAMKSFGLPAKAAKAVADAAKKAITDNYTKHYSKEAFEELVKSENITDVAALAKIVNEVMGDNYLETHTEIPNEASLQMLKFAKGLTDKYGVKTPIAPVGKPNNGNSGDPDPFEEALKNGVHNNIGMG